jgi:AraC family transcriptional regulator of adaptative response/methylated-DNA-[protein]-cysteine methyltransferase
MVMGESSLGDFIAASSDKGLVAFEFVTRGDEPVKALRARFPEAEIGQNEVALAELVGRLSDLVERPYVDAEIQLDARGSEFEQRVWDVLRKIPAGRTTSYGAVAAEMGTPRDARDVTDAISANTLAILIPCHRVVKKDGSLSGYRWGATRKRVLLQREQKWAERDPVS